MNSVKIYRNIVRDQVLRFNGADDRDLCGCVYDMKLTFDPDGPHIHL